MRKIIVYIASSFDQYIAKPDGNIDWLNDPEFIVEGEDFGYQPFLDSVDTTLMGNSTYQEILGFDIPFPYAEKTNYVFSKSKTGKDQHVKFVNEDIPSFVRDLKQQDGNHIWLIGGGQINTLLFDHQLIDRIILTIMPIRLGAGIPLFKDSEYSGKLKLESSKAYASGVVQLTYDCHHSPSQ